LLHLHLCVRVLRVISIGAGVVTRRGAGYSSGIRAQMSDHVWRDLLARGSRHTYEAREVLVRQGEAVHQVAVIEEGRVKITRAEVNGVEALLAISGAGEFVGETAVIEGEDSPVTVTALQLCKASLFTASQFVALLGGGELALQVLRHVISRRCEADEIRVELSLLPVSLRLVRMLLRLIDAAGVSRAGARVDLQMTQGDLARTIGASRSQVAVTLARLRRQGVLGTGRRHIVVRDHAGLQAIGAGWFAV
jgi:CRP/FNR family cyclic AMP-dependent transcriptional regulator